MYNLNDLIFFVQAVDLGSFAAAGRRLGQPKSTVSKRVAELEAALGARLIHRTSRSFVLTDTGRDFYDHARAAVIEAELCRAGDYVKLPTCGFWMSGDCAGFSQHNHPVFSNAERGVARI